jgi:hypothetical protein
MTQVVEEGAGLRLFPVGLFASVVGTTGAHAAVASECEPHHCVSRRLRVLRCPGPQLVCRTGRSARRGGHPTIRLYGRIALQRSSPASDTQLRRNLLPCLVSGKPASPTSRRVVAGPAVRCHLPFDIGSFRSSTGQKVRRAGDLCICRLAGGGGRGTSATSGRPAASCWPSPWRSVPSPSWPCTGRPEWRWGRTLPDGYDTLLDEDASGISAGQKQLLAAMTTCSPCTASTTTSTTTNSLMPWPAESQPAAVRARLRPPPQDMRRARAGPSPAVSGRWRRSP